MNLHSRRGWVTATWARRCPADTFVAVPWMGFEPMLSTVRAWRPLRAGPPGHRSVAQGGVEPPASLHLREGGLPVAYRASRPPPCQRAIGRRPASVGRVPGGSRTLKARRSPGCRPGAVARGLALPFAVWMAGFEPAWSGFRGRRMMPGSPTSRTLRLLPRPTKKARGHATPGLEGPRPEKGRVSLSQRVGGQRRGQVLALGRCLRPPTTEVRVTACHHALYFVRRRPRFCRRRSACASRTSS